MECARAEHMQDAYGAHAFKFETKIAADTTSVVTSRKIMPQVMTQSIKIESGAVSDSLARIRASSGGVVHVLK
jgi:hypothetical protein